MRYLIVNNSKKFINKNKGLYTNVVFKKFSTNINLNLNKPLYFQNNPKENEKSLNNVIDKVLINEKLQKGAVDLAKESNSEEVSKEEREKEMPEAVDPEKVVNIEETKEQAIEGAEAKEGEDVDFWFEEKVEEEFIPMWQKISKNTGKKETIKPGKLTPELLTAYLANQRATDIKVIDMKQKCDWADYIAICTVGSSRQLQNLSQKLRKFIKQCQPFDNTIPLKFEIEGDFKDEWLVIDLNTILIHIFLPKMRKEYDIEGIWESIKKNPTSPSSSSVISGNFIIEEPTNNDNEIEVEVKDRNIQKMLGEMRDQFIKENRVQLEEEENEKDTK